MTTFRLIHGDALDELKKLAAESLDSCVCDPPYGLRFMGATWDGKDIEKRMRERRSFSTDPDPKSGETGGHRSIAAEAGRYKRTANANAIFQRWICEVAAEVLRVLKPGAYFACFGSTRTYHRMACGIEYAGFQIQDQLAWVFGQGFPKSKNLGNGRGTALKPAWEPICLARKPIRARNLKENLKQHGTGALNIDVSKIPFVSDADEAEAKEKNRHGECESGPRTNQVYGKDDKPREDYDAHGRWPANLMHDGSDEVLEEFARVGDTTSRPHAGDGESLDTQGVGWGFKRMAGGFSDSGSVARFFFCAKASTLDRDAGIEAKTEYDHSGPRGHTLNGDGSPRPRPRPRPRGNIHPTVKPTALMVWLVRLLTPPGGTCLDWCMGSGSTGRACAIVNVSFIGIDLTAEYIPIAKARIDEARGELFCQHDEPTKPK